MGNINCSWFDRDRRIHHAVDSAFREMKKELLECIRAELTASRTQESDQGSVDPDLLPLGPPKLIRQ